MYLLRVKGGNRGGRGPNKCDPGQNRSESVSPIHPWKSMSTRVLQCQRLEREKSPDYISAMIFCWYLLFLAALYKIVWKHGLDEPPRGSKTSLRRSGCYWVGKDPRLIIRSSIFKQTQSFTNKLQISCSVGILSTRWQIQRFKKNNVSYILNIYLAMEKHNSVELVFNQPGDDEFAFCESAGQRKGQRSPTTHSNIIHSMFPIFCIFSLIFLTFWIGVILNYIDKCHYINELNAYAENQKCAMRM